MSTQQQQPAFLNTWASTAKVYISNGAVCGVLYGANKGWSEAQAAGLARGSAAFARSVAQRTALTGLGWASFFTVYTAALVGIERARKDARHNLMNSLAAGTLTGCVMALRATRNPPVIAITGALSGGLCVAIDAVGHAAKNVSLPRGLPPLWNESNSRGSRDGEKSHKSTE